MLSINLFRSFQTRGFSLIEVVMAMAILSIGILAAMQMGLLATRNIVSGNIVTEAVLLAQSEIEKIRSHNSLVSLADTFPDKLHTSRYLRVGYAFVDPGLDDFDDPGLVNCETGTDDGSGMCIAIVTVSWQRGGGGRGGHGQVTLKTMLGEAT